MIFNYTYKQILSGRKSCTLRLQYLGDAFKTLLSGELAIVRSDGRARWVVGRIYAVQPERCHFAVCWIRMTKFEAVADPLVIDQATAVAEGAADIAEFLKIWHQLHRKHPSQPCWRLWFEIVSAISVSSVVQNVGVGHEQKSVAPTKMRNNREPCQVGCFNPDCGVKPKASSTCESIAVRHWKTRAKV
jgi:hypothetical protein